MMVNAPWVDVLRVPPASVNLSDTYDFQQTQVRGISLAVDLDARKRIAAAAEVAKSRAAALSVLPSLIEMLGQDRITGSAGNLVERFSSGNATTNDARRAENMVWLAEADLACQVAASDALGGIGADAVPALTEALRSPNANQRSGAAKALGKIGSAAEVSLPQLKELARSDSEETVRKAAAEAAKLIKPRWFSF